MKGRRGWAIAAASLLLCVDAASAQVQGPAATEGRVLTFTDEVPCPPTAASPHVVHRVRHVRKRRVRPLVRVARKAPAPARRPVHRVLVKHLVHRVRRPLVRAAAPVAAPRCTVLRRERLTPASFGVTPEQVELTPVADVIEPGGPNIGPLTSGRPALPNVINPSAGGGEPGVGAAPEPGTWALMMFGVAALGAGLRRRRRALYQASVGGAS